MATLARRISSFGSPPWPGNNQWNGSIQLVADHDWYKVTVAAGQGITASTHQIGAPAACPFDTKLHLVNGAGMELVSDDDGGQGLCSMISPALNPQAGNLPAGAYYLWVQQVSDGIAAGPYQLDVTVQ